jgi:hypothetical protein
MTGFDDDRSEERVREDTIDNLLAENDLNDLQRMKSEMEDLANETGDDREEDLLRYRLGLVEEAIDRIG